MCPVVLHWRSSRLTPTISDWYAHNASRSFADVWHMCEGAQSRHEPELISLLLSGAVKVFKRKKNPPTTSFVVFFLPYLIHVTLLACISMQTALNHITIREENIHHVARGLSVCLPAAK